MIIFCAKCTSFTCRYQCFENESWGEFIIATTYVMNEMIYKFNRNADKCMYMSDGISKRRILPLTLYVAS